MNTNKQFLILIGILFASSTLLSQVKFTTSSGGAPTLYLDCPLILKVEKVNLKNGEKSKLQLTCDANEGVVTATDQANVFRVIAKKERIKLTVLENGGILTQESFVVKPIPNPVIQVRHNGKEIVTPSKVSKEEEITVTAIAAGDFGSDEYKESNKYVVKGLKISTVWGVKTISSGSFIPKQLGDFSSNDVLGFLEITISRFTYDNREVPMILKFDYALLLK